MGPDAGLALPGRALLRRGLHGWVVQQADRTKVPLVLRRPKVSKVDIPCIVDDANSMSPKQDRVKANFVSFMKFLSDPQIDHHLGGITTDTFVVKAANQTEPANVTCN